MKLYTGPVSLFSAKVRIALDEKRLVPDEHVSVGWSPTARYLPHHPDVVRLNPRREVPVLVDGDAVITDSTTILEYLEECYPEPALYPTTAQARARCRTLESFADQTFFAPLWDLIEEGFYPAEAAEGGSRNTARLDAAIASLSGFHRELDGELQGERGDREYLCGAFSVADIANFVMVSAGATLGAPPDASLTRLGGWLGRVLSRPPVAKELAGMQATVASFATAEAAAGAA